MPQMKVLKLSEAETHSWHSVLHAFFIPEAMHWFEVMCSHFSCAVHKTESAMSSPPVACHGRLPAMLHTLSAWPVYTLHQAGISRQPAPFHIHKPLSPYSLRCACR